MGSTPRHWGRPEAALLVVSLLWGITFPLVKSGLVDASPVTFLALRFPVGLLVLWPILGFRRPQAPAWRAGSVLAAAMAVSYLAQTAGLEFTSPTRSAFITGLAVVVTPVIYFLRAGHAPGWTPGGGAILAAGGLWFLTGPGDGGPNRGDLLTLLAALGYAVYIVELEVRSGSCDFRDLLVVQFLILSGAFLAGALVEQAPVRATGGLAVAVVLSGAILGVSMYLQTRFQRGTTAPRAGVIYSTEPVFAAAFSFLLLGETLTGGQWGGAALMFAGMILAMWPPRPRGRVVDPRPDAV